MVCLMTWESMVKSAAMLRVVAVGGEEEERHHEAGESHGLGEDDGLEDILEVLVRVGIAGVDVAVQGKFPPVYTDTGVW